MIVALYARVSTTKQAEKDLSIPDQLHQMREWCKARHHQVAVEYVESGASAMDDKRPVFQKMIGEACTSPAPYEAILVHSLSRFFRDMIEFGLYERRLKKHGVVVLSMTQQTSDDPAGEMARRIFSLFDEYQSKENGKHTLRAMKENARQGFFNGSIAPYGFRVVEDERQGRKGRKKRLEVDPSESAMVQRIFHLYLTGFRGQPLGMKGLAAHLNEKGLTMRGRQWRRTLVNKILSDRLYLGEYYFNRMDNHSHTLKPQEEWVPVNLQPIIDAETFERAARRRRERTATNVPPRVVSSPTLLTGLLRCGCCGSRMTLATGKGGRYRYYKCSSKVNTVGVKACDNRNVPMERLDDLILQTVAERIFTPERVTAMMKDLRDRLKKARSQESDKIRELSRELEEITQRTERLYEAVEKGFLPMDATLQERAHRHQARRQEILMELASLRWQKETPLDKLGVRHIAAFCTAIRAKFLDRESNFGKEYLKLLVNDIRVVKKEVHLTGSYASMAGALCMSTKPGSFDGVPSFDLGWLPMCNPFHNRSRSPAVNRKPL